MITARTTLGRPRSLLRWVTLVLLLTLSLPGASAAASGPEVPTAHVARTLVADARRALKGGLSDLLTASGIGSTPRPASISPSAVIPALAGIVEEVAGRIEASLPEDLDADRLRTATRRSAVTGRLSSDPLPPDARRAVRRGAAEVAAALDAALPALRGMTPGGVPGVPVDGCDLVDQAPALCVAGQGDNVITEDYALVVDLGGSDLHAHSAGGADPLGNGLPVSVTIDLGGDDRYEAASPTPSGSWTSQGGGYLGGVGFLVDVAGNDSYRIAPEGPLSLAMGQGNAESGVGVLADLAGNDAYELSATGPGWVVALGQGQAANGAAFLVDREGDDDYAVTTLATNFLRPEIGPDLAPSAASVGLGVGRVGFIYGATPNPVHIDFGFAGRGYALFADDRGTDSMVVEATSADPEADEWYGPSLFGLPLARALGLGYGESTAAGLAVLGEGPTTASVTSAAHAPKSRADTDGMGISFDAGAGVLSDAGGDDVWTLGSEVSVERRAAASCAGCPPPASAAESGSVMLRGMGHATGASSGLLEDAGGDDRYLAEASNSARAITNDHRPDGKEGRAHASAGPILVSVQGAGDNFGLGTLHDATGNDLYEIVADGLAGSSVVAEQATDPQGTAIGPDVTVVGQSAGRAFGSGRLVDLGGTDTYRTTSATTAEASPASTLVTGAATAGVLASVDQGSSASFVDLDGGLDDVYSASPATEACTGTRGQEAWVDCGGAGTGLMA